MHSLQSSSLSSQNPQFFKVLPSSQFKSSSLQNYQALLKILKTQTYLYVDFNKPDQDSLIFLQKTQTPTKHLSQDHEEDDHHDLFSKQIQQLGNQYILDVNNLSKPSYKMIRYVSESKKLMNKKKNIDQMESDFVKNFQEEKYASPIKLRMGSAYRKTQEKNKKLQYSSKIAPEKLQEYLESKEYRKVEKKLEKSEKELEKFVLSVKELKQKETQMDKSLIFERNLTFSNSLGSSKSGCMNLLNLRKRSSLSVGKADYLTKRNSELGVSLKLPKLKRFSQVLESTFNESGR